MIAVAGVRAAPRGFTVIELLIALAIVLSIAGAVAQVVPPARAAFDRLPAELELQQRGRTAIDMLSQALRSAGKDVAAHQALGFWHGILPAVSLADPDASGDAFTTLIVTGPSVDGAQGVLVADQPGAAAPFTLALAPCPNIKDVCGFTPGMTAIIADGSGRFDVFVVAQTAADLRAVTADRGFSNPYPVGSAVIEIDQYTFSLADQADGSLSLIRRTAAGAIQPMVDFVSALSFRAADQQIDIAVTVQATTATLRGVLAERVFRTSIRLRNAS